MLSGRRLDLLDPSPNDIEIEDIAHGLARVARWNGQTVGEHAFSVAQHALLVEEIADRDAAGPHAPLAARGAPARRAGIRDRRSDQSVQGRHRPRLQGVRDAPARGHPPPLRPAAALPGPHYGMAIKAADRIAAFYEATQLAGFTETEANRYFGVPRGVPASLGERLRGLDPAPIAAAQAEFLDRFQELSQE